jgi:hypothetical protein
MVAQLQPVSAVPRTTVTLEPPPCIWQTCWGNAWARCCRNSPAADWLRRRRRPRNEASADSRHSRCRRMHRSFQRPGSSVSSMKKAISDLLLLDVNVLVALAWPNHQFHLAAIRRLESRRNRWATCALTQLGFIRLSSNPVAVPSPRRPAEAAALLRIMVQDARHVYLEALPSAMAQGFGTALEGAAWPPTGDRCLSVGAGPAAQGGFRDLRCQDEAPGGARRESGSARRTCLTGCRLKGRLVGPATEIRLETQAFAPQSEEIHLAQAHGPQPHGHRRHFQLFGQP